MATSDGSAQPWWHKSGAFATVTGLLLAIGGGIISVSSSFLDKVEKDRAWQLEKEKQLHDLRLAYLDRLAEPLSRKEALEFILMSDQDPTLKHWAERELVEARKEVEELQQEITQGTKSKDQSRANVQKLQDDLRKTSAKSRSTDVPPAEKAASAKAAAKIEQDLAHAQDDLAEKEANVNRSRMRLKYGAVVQAPDVVQVQKAPTVRPRAPGSRAPSAQ